MFQQCTASPNFVSGFMILVAKSLTHNHESSAPQAKVDTQTTTAGKQQLRENDGGGDVDPQKVENGMEKRRVGEMTDTKIV
jgi:hypothetical protein